MIDETPNTGRVVYLDYLRILATCAVVFNHVDCPLVEQAAGLKYPTDRLFLSVNFAIDSLGSFPVPVFVMISGALFLNRNVPLKKIYSKYALRLLISWFVWSILYVLFLDGSVFFKIWSVLNSLSQPHLWFLPLMIGIYLGIPIFKQIVASDEVMKYFLALAFVFNFLISSVSLNIDLFGSDFLYKLKSLSGIDKFTALMGMQVVLGVSSYFILGYFLNKTELKTQTRVVVYTLGILAVVATYFYYWSSPYKNVTRRPDLFITEQIVSLRHLFMSVALFVFVKRRALQRNKFVEKMSKYSFGAFLVHYLVTKLLAVFFNLSVASFNPLISFPLIATATIVISFSISAILHRIPVVNKYLV